MKQPETKSNKMKKVDLEKLFVANGHYCYYGNPVDVFDLARNEKINFYVMYPVRNPLFNMNRMIEIVGDPNIAYADPGTEMLPDNHRNDSCLSRFMLNTYDIIAGLCEDLIPTNWMDEFFILASSMIRAGFDFEKPKYSDGREVTFDQYVKDHLVIIKDEAEDGEHNGVYATDEIALMAFCVFGTRDQYVQFGNWLMHDYQPTDLFERDYGQAYRGLLAKFSEDGLDHELKQLILSQLEKQNQKNNK
ncbi:hypothetical protein [Methanobrevibacter sp.]